MKSIITIKNIIIAIAIFLNVTFPVYSLPNQTYENFQIWVKNHKFLSPWAEAVFSPYEKFNKLEDGANQDFIVFRRLQDNWFIDIRVDYGYFDKTTKLNKDSKEEYTQISLVKKEYSPNKEFDELNHSEEGAIYDDHRPWLNIDCKDLWDRKNSTATELLKHAYSQEIADDFSSSKLVFNGEYIFSRASDGVDDQIDGNDVPFVITSDLLDNFNLMYIERRPNTQIYEGKYFSYIVRNKAWIVKNKSCRILEIVDKSIGHKKVQAVNKNIKVLNDWIAKKNKLEEERIKPADIKVN